MTVAFAFVIQSVTWTINFVVVVFAYGAAAFDILVSVLAG